MTEVERLAHEIAEEAARELIDSSSLGEMRDGVEWRDLTDEEFDYLVDFELELKYLELRGILRRHPTEPQLVRVLTDEERAQSLTRLQRAAKKGKRRW